MLYSIIPILSMFRGKEKVEDRAFQLLKWYSSIGVIGLCYYILWTCFHIGIKCPMNTLFNLDCGFCGLTRLCISLIHFDFIAAYEYNKVVFLLLPLFSYYLLLYSYRYILYGITRFKHNEEKILWLCFISIMIYGVFRNII